MTTPYKLGQQESHATIDKLKTFLKCRGRGGVAQYKNDSIFHTPIITPANISTAYALTKLHKSNIPYKILKKVIIHNNNLLIYLGDVLNSHQSHMISLYKV